MKNAFKDNLWRKVWIGNEIFDSSYCETCYVAAEEWAKSNHPKSNEDELVEKTLELLDHDFSDEIYGELWCNGSKIFYVGYCDECGTPFIDFGKGGMLELLLDDFFFGEGDPRFNYAEFLKRHYQQVKEIKKIREEEPPEYRGAIKETYKFDFPALVEHVEDIWGYEIHESGIKAIGALI